MEESTLALSIPEGYRSPHLQQLTLVEHLKQCILKLSVLFPKLSSFPTETFSRRWSASAKVIGWAVLSYAPLVVLSCRNWALSLAWSFCMCLIKLVVLNFAVLPPPLQTFILQTLQTAVKQLVWEMWNISTQLTLCPTISQITVVIRHCLLHREACSSPETCLPSTGGALISCRHNGQLPNCWMTLEPQGRHRHRWPQGRVVAALQKQAYRPAQPT